MARLRSPDSPAKNAMKAIMARHGIINTAEALRSGIYPKTLYQLLADGYLERISRGLYRVADKEPLSYPDLAIVGLRVPKAILCLVSALSYHGLTTQVPHTVSIALAKGAETPRLDFPPLTVHRFSGSSLDAGVEDHRVDGVVIRVFCPEKTICDCFKFRTRLGMDIVLEALKTYRARKKPDFNALVRYARICRVENVMRPYLEVLA